MFNLLLILFDAVFGFPARPLQKGEASVILIRRGFFNIGHFAQKVLNNC